MIEQPVPRNQPPDLQTYHAATPNLAQESAVHPKTRKKDQNKHSKGKKNKKKTLVNKSETLITSRAQTQNPRSNQIKWSERKQKP